MSTRPTSTPKSNSYKKYGHFSEDNFEFVITRPDTPAPWINYASNGRYTRLISNVGGGYSFWVTPKLSRLTRHRYNSMPLDRPGHYLYVRDRATGDYWSPSWQPCMKDLQHYECRHGLNYTRITGRRGGVEVSVLTFIAREDDVEIQRVTVKNLTKKAVDLDFFSYVELGLGNALNDLVNQPNDQHFNDVFFDKKSEILYSSKRYWNTFGAATVEQSNQDFHKYIYMASDLKVSGFDGSKSVAIGRWRSEQNPEFVERGKCGNTEITSGDACLALQLPVKLKAGETKDFVVTMGVVDRATYKTDAARLAKKYRNVAAVDKEYAAIVADWRNYVSCVQIETPDDDMNRMINVWNQYQTSCTFRFSRDASYYHGGLLFGRGFRDSCQDTFGPLMTRPQWVRQRLVEMSTHQFVDGSVVHCYYPLSGGYAKTGHSDTPLWFSMATCMYIKETGDFTILKEQTPYEDSPKKASYLEHLYGTLDYVLTKQLTKRNLPKFGPGDWNDTLDYMGRKGKGESVWNAMCLCYVLKMTVELCERIGDNARAKKYQAAFKKVADAVNKLCWDGNWYIVGTNDLGERVGTAKSKECRVYLNTQTWAVMSGIASPDRAKKALTSAYQHCMTPKGPKILHPAFRTVNPNIGLATRCVPGKKENGAVFNHPVSWAVLAEALQGNGDRAYEYYRAALPMNPVVSIDRYEMEPYVYSEYVTSPDHPLFGQASHAWLTGSSTWMLRDCVDYIMGVRPEYDGLVIDPCLPTKWKTARIRRKFRGKIYDVSIKNPQGVSKGVVSIKVDGALLKGNLIRIAETTASKPGQEPVVKVEVLLGAKKK